MFILLIIILPILVIYPYNVSKTINENIIEKETNIKKIILNMGLVFLITIIAIYIISYFLNIYDNLIPESTSSLCSNTGGWTYSCKGSIQAIPILLIIGLLITVYHFISQKFIYKVFEYSKGIFKHIYMYIHMLVIYFLNFWLFLYLYGLLITVHYDSILIELLRIIVLISPSGLFLISTAIYGNKKQE